MWTSHKELCSIIEQHLTNFTEGPNTELETILRKHRQQFVSLLDNPVRGTIYIEFHLWAKSYYFLLYYSPSQQLAEMNCVPLSPQELYYLEWVIQYYQKNLLMKLLLYQICMISMNTYHCNCYVQHSDKCHIILVNILIGKYTCHLFDKIVIK